MSSLNNRKEPTLGESATPAQSDNALQVPKISVHTTKAPAFNFTPTELAYLGQTPRPAGVTTSDNEAEASIPTPTEEITEPVATDTISEPTTPESATPPQTEGLSAERVIPVAPNSSPKNNDTQEPTKFGKKSRLVVVALFGLLVSYLIFWLLKPDQSTTVNELQSEQGSSLPLELRPINEDEAKRAEEIAIQQHQAQEATAQSAATVPVAETAPTAPTTQPLVQTNEPAPPVVQPIQPVAQPMPQVQPIAEPTPALAPAVAPVVAQPQTTPSQAPATPVVSRPKTQNSVIYQPETHQESREKAHKAPLKVKKVEAEKKSPVVKTPAQKPASKEPKNEAKAPAKPTPVATRSASKTLTVPKGVSLMQVFRNHNLNISDVNAMSKAAGANNVLSQLKAGERVSVQLDAQNRVTEMRLSNGNRFVRRADGSYSFIK